MEKIKERTLEVISEMEGFIVMKERGKTFNIPEDQYKKLISIVKYKDQNIAKLDALIAAK